MEYNTQIDHLTFPITVVVGPVRISRLWHTCNITYYTLGIQLKQSGSLNIRLVEECLILY